MVIEIKENMQVKDLKKQFHQYYPMLKIEFFSQGHEVSQGTSKSQMLDNETPLKDLIKGKEGNVDFGGNISVQSFEQMFADTFNLNVQVFRKSGSVYIETTQTDDWTLDQAHHEALASQVQSESAESDFTDRDKWE